MSTDIEFSDLPAEVVRHILSYVSSRQEAALVCKEFYEHICSIEKDYYKVSLNSKIHINGNNTQYIDNMLESRRQINEISLSGASGSDSEKLDSVIAKFGEKIESFTLHCCSVTDNQLSRWINKMPLLEKMIFENTSIDNPEDESILTLNLANLTNLTFKDFVFGKNTNFIYGIATGTIKELTWDIYLRPYSFSIDKLNHKKTKLEGSSAKPGVLSKIINDDFDALCYIFSQQRNLTSLTLRNVSLNDELFSIICGLEKLEYLHFTVDFLSASSLANTEHMKNLKSLVVNDGSKEILDCITKLNMPRLEFLGLLMFRELDDCWSKMEGRFSGIKHVHLIPCFKLEIINAMMREFPKLESIKLAMTEQVTVKPYEPDRSLDFGNMKKVFIGVNPFFPFHLDVIPFFDLCQNLEEITLFTPQDISVLHSFLQTRKKLKKLGILLDEKSSDSPKLSSNLVNCLKDSGPDLRLLCIIFQVRELRFPIDMTLLRNHFIDRFPVIVHRLINASQNLILKKRGEQQDRFK